MHWPYSAGRWPIEPAGAGYGEAAPVGDVEFGDAPEADTDRNLFVFGATYNGTAVDGAGAELWSQGSVSRRFVDRGPATDPAGWTLVYEDDFGDGDLGGSWDRYQGTSGHSKVNWVAENAYVENGAVTLRVDTTENRAGAISTQGSVVQAYGKVEMRARMDAGNGTGLALLLWPRSQQWPADGEIDFAETPRRDAVWHTNHDQAGDGTHQYDSRRVELDATRWHTYGVKWTPASIRFFVDSEQTYEITDPARIPDGPMFLAAQTEYVGDCSNGDWIPCPDASTPAVVRAQIDDVRIWSRSG